MLKCFIFDSIGKKIVTTKPHFSNDFASNDVLDITNFYKHPEGIQIISAIKLFYGWYQLNE